MNEQYARPTSRNNVGDEQDPTERIGRLKRHSVVGARMQTILTTLISMDGSIESESPFGVVPELRDKAGLTSAQWSIAFTVVKGLDVLEFEPDVNARYYTAIHLNTDGIRKAVQGTFLPESLLEELDTHESVHSHSVEAGTVSQ